jgi:hypothetical protein
VRLDPKASFHEVFGDMTWIRREVLGFSARMAEKRRFAPRYFAAVDQF